MKITDELFATASAAYERAAYEGYHTAGLRAALEAALAASPAQALAETDTVVIWSGEHGAYWRPEARGYTTDIDAAGRYEREVAIRATAHCGPEKKIEIRPAPSISTAADALTARARMAADLEWLGDQAQALAKALRPFADAAKRIPTPMTNDDSGINVRCGDLRAAKKALAAWDVAQGKSDG